MRTTEERIKLMHDRAEQIRRESRMRKVRVMQTVSMMAGLAAVIVIAVLMPGFTAVEAPDIERGGLYASLFADSGMLGFIVIGIIAFALGIAVTVFCYTLKAWRSSGEEDK